MKAGLAAIVGAVAGLRRLGLAPLAPVQLQSVVEEECGGNGALQCAIAGLQADAVVIPEPYPGFIPTVAGRRPLVPRRYRGCRPLTSRKRRMGVNAIEAAYAIVA